MPYIQEDGAAVPGPKVFCLLKRKHKVLEGKRSKRRANNDFCLRISTPPSLRYMSCRLRFVEKSSLYQSKLNLFIYVYIRVRLEKHTSKLLIYIYIYRSRYY